jgi:hypothetical protein
MDTSKEIFYRIQYEDKVKQTVALEKQVDFYKTHAEAGLEHLKKLERLKTALLGLCDTAGRKFRPDEFGRPQTKVDVADIRKIIEENT